MSFRTDPSNINGSIAPLITPFKDNGQLDTDSLRRLVEWQIDAGTHGISIGGSTGEPSSQTIDERIEAIEVVADAVAGRVPFIAGTGSAKLDETLKLTAAADRAGVDAALVITPYYARPTQQALYEWYDRVASETPDLPIIMYNVPSRTAVELAPDTVARLHRDVVNIVGIKETTRDFEHFSRVIEAADKGLLVWSGIELLCLPLLALGGIGFISATANIAPRACAEMYEYWMDGKYEEARRIHYALHPLVDLLFVETNPTTAKLVLEREGRIDSAHVRPPLISTTASGIAKVDHLLARAAGLMEHERAGR
ncbi:4-hydroxy-tetrahydrodipicolinate synthase [Rhodococcus sp. 05-340-1]|uniref:4-hydroxy-tetrahydrodipicolinate synthase n=1 Tax=Nocardiaceae TaxID=85025 RepID=UPI00050CFEA3|nr:MULTISPECIES: 4-hydroxy-tetrahydrodipicolinate synthase [Rhodococcus]OZC87669.1 4-hydroxy-tetrahydrodipicolinate synthase [Rhodococcus sp. 06-412-2C]OZC96320.1 4-hydroxy-tetrahydrodipicolinate synthase [Rhodococcus sp. 06-412-2B]OZD65303.1 4-hydroxy-tetrahydrodipicolinate synthase [Rhodococcus sp. 05-340-2]OZD74651.1 4-hydroxy-tetrahydrodipicolinate synthase [Rhodococcus sp. 05-340-1]OZD86576.1 4-hydroxy-tetrahydrodipicolinate synthase [Rhodococcus sp. 05-339-2]